MKIEIKGPWHKKRAFAEQDRDYFAHLFQLEHGFGIHGVNLTDSKEWRATCEIELDEYEIEKKK